MVAVEIMPRALGVEPSWAVIVAFVGGGAFYVLADYGVQRLRQRFASGDSGGSWVIFFGVSVDLFADGVLIGTGSTIAPALGLLLAIAQVPADLPEGFASIASFRRTGTPRRTRLALSATFALPILIGATIGFFAMRDAPDLYRLVLLTFTAGILTTLVIEELVPEAHEALEQEQERLAPLVFSAGFALFALLSTYLG